MNHLVLQQLRDVLIDGKFPSETVKVKGAVFEFTFVDRDISLCNTVMEIMDFLSKAVKCSVRGSVIPLIDLPSAYFYPLQIAYSTFQCTMLCTLLEMVSKFVESVESRGLWLVYKHSDPSYVFSINRKLNSVQQRWVMLNTVNDTKNNMEMVTDIFEGIKPWLDKELYAKIKEQEDTARENVFFNDPQYDAKLRKKAKQTIVEQQTGTDIDTEGDIIIEEEEG